MTKDKKNRPTELICVLDRSGSMRAIREDAEGGFNEFIDKRRDDGNHAVTLWQFDNEIERVWDRQELTAKTPRYSLEPRNMTALNDALGKAITSAADIPKKANVIVIVVTDGMENASREYSRDAVRRLVKEREEAGWSFVFIGAGIDAFAEASSYGIAAASTMSSAATPHAVHETYAVMDSAIQTASVTGTRVQFTDEDRERVAKADEGA